MCKALLDRFRYPEELVAFRFPKSGHELSGFFRFGEGAPCYGTCYSGATKPRFGDDLHDASKYVRPEDGVVWLPFDPSHTIENLCLERYAAPNSVGLKSISDENWIRNLYYALRPALPIAVRKHIQRSYLRGWKDIRFPQWPLDCAVEVLFERLLLCAMKSRGMEKIPFIWFWPNGAPSCAMMTHDVEGAEGRDFCSRLMDIDDSFQIKSSFQVVPEKRYDVPQSYLDDLRQRGFEINVHDLNHDGHLFSNRELFLRRVVLINRYAAKFGAKGFRSGVLYRNLDWYGALRVSYDMSVPNVGNLDFQRGGCCTIMPYFIGDILELPLTTTQDYTLFHILGDHSLEIWKQQIALIGERNGLASFNIHPDYLASAKARRICASLLEILASLREKENWWIALPGEIDRWWRQRSQMRLVRDGQRWRIEGAGSERARLAYAQIAGDRLEYVIPAESSALEDLALAGSHIH